MVLKPITARHWQGILLLHRGDQVPPQPTTDAASDTELEQRFKVLVRQMFRSFLQPSCSPAELSEPTADAEWCRAPGFVAAGGETMQMKFSIWLLEGMDELDQCH